jgi:hypothetical protein
MIRRFWILSLAISASLGLAVGPTTAQQSGGILKFFHRDSPASMSIHEEATISTVAPMMGVFNNVVYPAAASPELAKDGGATTLVIINREPTGLETFADLVLNRPIGETLGRRLGRPRRS